MKHVGTDKLDVYVTRADSLFAAMEHLAEYDLKEFGSAVALLAVHATISLADALFVAVKGQRCTEETHGAAIKELSKMCAARDLDNSGVAYFQWLVRRKNDVAYIERRFDANDIKLARVKAQSFAAWARRQLAPSHARKCL